MDGSRNLEKSLFMLYIVPILLDLAAHMKYNYYVSYVNRKDFYEYP
jgi:hypothetical protein